MELANAESKKKGVVPNDSQASGMGYYKAVSVTN